MASATGLFLVADLLSSLIKKTPFFFVVCHISVNFAPDLANCLSRGAHSLWAEIIPSNLIRVMPS